MIYKLFPLYINKVYNITSQTWLLSPEGIYGSKDPEEGSSQNKQFIEKSAREMKPCNS